MTDLLGWFFAITAVGALLILGSLVLHAVPRILATLTVIVTLAALAAAIPH
ncbi:hypothetical protein [Streptomyces clavifer]|uniref:hypothetical protein n=1 Tax=Streptomyces clavifer TaxID=68188 RepID=UPI00308B785C|nr:hypothetical protein OG388_26745 [Streptomyces clavifer]